MAELPTGTVTFLFTDIEGSTRLERQLRDRYGEALAEHQRLLRAAFSAHGGHEVDTQGDSFFYVFPRAGGAVAAAVEAQRALAAHGWPEDGEIRVRIGINTGEASLEDGRYVGFAVHRAARISAAAHGGQILLSSTTRELVSDDLPPDQSVRDLGERRLKDLPRPERLYQLVVDDLPSDFAPPKTLDEQELAEAAQQALTRRRYQRRAALVIPAALLAGAAVLAAVLLLTRSSGGITADPNSVAIIDPGKNKVVDTVAVGIRPSAIAFGAGSVWAANADDKTLSRIDPETREEIGRFPVPATPTGVAVLGGAVWIANGLLGSVSRFEPDVNAVTETIEIATQSSGGSIAAGEGSVWAVFANSYIGEIDPDTNDLDGPSFVGASPTGITVGAGSIWVADGGGNSVLQLNPRTLGAVGSVGVGRSPRGITFGADAVWVALDADDDVTRIDADAHSTVPIAVGDRPTAVAFGAGSTWVANAEDGTVQRIDAGTNDVVETIRVGGRPVAIMVAAGAVWVAVQAPLSA
jgi:YVTN family beta-propeller protein